MAKTLVASAARAVGAALVTLMGLGGALYPRPLFADRASGWTQPLSKSGVQVGELLVAGRIVEDRATPSGWAIDVRVENTGTDSHVLDLETDLTRSVYNPANRVVPEGHAIWGFKDHVDLLAGHHVRRRYALSIDMATLLTANQAGFDNGGYAKNPMSNRMEPITTTYALRIQCPGFGEADINPS